MIVLQKVYSNGVVRDITVLAVTATDDPLTVALSTADSGDMILCQTDQPDLWSQLELAGGLPA